MNVTFSERAIEKLNTQIKNKDKKLKLKYETEGCGCVMSGVTALWLVDSEDDDDLVFETNYQPLLVEKSKMVFLDENMTIDFLEQANCYMLKSPNEILNPRLRLVEVSDVHEFQS
ncbi:iron-sulfur cluster biosynthesis family protein [Fredinandcohnia sp. QZ13]|uniref:iron-sulfur cluster biosynthesis family protein n=1 Tax=Fredinandcohnia sp. QZ13 TaxID=3073144 RepID=UPI00285330E1|nr:iron-sulfur cluster biosynthesis family protein [Fredinandcohnia sp. QZ13]MDR4888817.1 iron-sulfur cluster biosynthesis family protein [Fredinandcohnia sp. QZ13]